MAFLIDKHLPEYSYNEFHEKVVNASAEKCFLITKNLDMGESLTTRYLMRLRGLPSNDLTLQGFIKNNCFTYLEEDLNKEFVIDASRSNTRIIWNFSFAATEENKTVVSTETRILCLTKRSKILFSVYWFFVKPFSGLIRLEMLRLIKKKAESS